MGSRPSSHDPQSTRHAFCDNGNQTSQETDGSECIICFEQILEGLRAIGSWASAQRLRVIERFDRRCRTVDLSSQLVQAIPTRSLTPYWLAVVLAHTCRAVDIGSVRDRERLEANSVTSTDGSSPLSTSTNSET